MEKKNERENKKEGERNRNRKNDCQKTRLFFDVKSTMNTYLLINWMRQNMQKSQQKNQNLKK